MTAQGKGIARPDMPTPFLTPKFEGARFDGHRLPLDLLRELVLFEELILETARWLYMEQNPGKKRLPRGWREGFSLSLADVAEGSAMPVLVMEDTEATEDDLFRQHFEKARDTIIEAISAAPASGQQQVLPRQLGKYFEKIGAGLRDGEQIVFGRPESLAPAILTTEVRRRLVPPNAPYQKHHEVVGTIFEVNQRARTYHILDGGDRTIFARFAEEDHDRIMGASNNYRNGELFRVRGNGLFNPDGSLKEIVETFDIEPEGQRITGLIEKFGALEKGWFDGTEGEPFSPQALHWLENQWHANVPASLPTPKFFPTVEGNLSVEWRIDQWDASLEIDLGKRQAYFHALNLDTDVEREADELDLTTPEGWEGFVNPLQELLGREVDA